jgi:phosphate transport system substrate-binding protein
LSFVRNGLPRLIVLGLALSLFAAACGDSAADDGSGGGGGVTGEVVISGSSTVEPISAFNAEKFSAENPDVSISVDGPGTSDGFELFCNGETDISDASRPIDTEEEVTACADNGIEFIELKVAIDGLSVITAVDNNEVECLSFSDLYALLGAEAEGFENWSDANDLAGELEGPTNAPYLDAPLVVTAPGEESGTYDSFGEIVLEDIAYEERGVSEDKSPIRPDYQASANDNVIIEGISGTPTSLGWVGYAFFIQNSETVKALAIDGGEGCVEPTEDTISSGEYPIARDLFIYVNTAKLEENPAVEAYVDFYLSDAGLASVAEVGYVDLADEDIQATQDAWSAKETGTREG